MQSCQVCGRSFDPLGFQVVVPELGRGFDRFECAQSARALAGPGARIVTAPLVAGGAPLMAAALAPAAATAAASRSLVGSSAATFGFLLAGTVAAAFLWIRVLGTDPSSFTLGRLTAPPAFGHETVQAEAAIRTEAQTPGKPAERTATVTVERVVFVPSIPAPPPTVSVGNPGKPSSSPSTPARPVTPQPTDLPGGKITGKGHQKHGKGHFMHGDDGWHGPGHKNGAAGGAGNSDHGQGKGNGHGKGKGKGKDKD